MSDVPELLLNGLPFGKAKLETVEKSPVLVLVLLVELYEVDALDHRHFVLVEQHLEVLQLDQVLVDVLDFARLGILLPDCLPKVEAILQAVAAVAPVELKLAEPDGEVVVAVDVVVALPLAQLPDLFYYRQAVWDGQQQEASHQQVVKGV